MAFGQRFSVTLAESLALSLSIWATEAEQVLLRTRQLARSGSPVEIADALEHAFGHVQADGMQRRHLKLPTLVRRLL